MRGPGIEQLRWHDPNTSFNTETRGVVGNVAMSTLMTTPLRQTPNSSFFQIILAPLIYLPYYPVLQLTTRPRLFGKHIWCRLASKLQNGTSGHLLVQLCQIQNTKYLIQIPNAGLLPNCRTAPVAILRCNYAKYKIPNT